MATFVGATVGTADASSEGAIVAVGEEVIDAEVGGFGSISSELSAVSSCRSVLELLSLSESSGDANFDCNAECGTFCHDVGAEDGAASVGDTENECVAVCDGRDAPVMRTHREKMLSRCVMVRVH